LAVGVEGGEPLEIQPAGAGGVTVSWVLTIINVVTDLVQERVFKGEAAQAVRFPLSKPNIALPMNPQTEKQLGAIKVFDPPTALPAEFKFQRNKFGAEVDVRSIARIVVAVTTQVPRGGHETHRP
jgi:hypothetical protein